MNETKKEVVAVRRNEEGNLCCFKLNDGTEYDFNQCWEAITRGELDLIATTGKEGVPVIKSRGDEDLSNNLQNLPSF